MSRFTINLLRYTGLALLALLLLTFVIFGLFRAFASGQVLANVTAGPLDLGGLTETEAQEMLDSFESSLGSQVARFTINGEQISMRPEQVGFDINRDRLLEEAMQFGREGNIFSQFWWWLRHFSQTEILTITPEVDSSSVAQLIEDWNQQYVADPPFPGEIYIQGTFARPRYPTSGFLIDQDQARRVITRHILSEDAGSSVIPIVEVVPDLEPADLDRAVAQANLWMAAPVRLVTTDGTGELLFSPEEIAGSLEFEYGTDQVDLSITTEAIGEKILTDGAGIEQPPTEPRLEFVGDLVTVVAGTRGTLLDPATTARNLEIAAGTSSRVGVLPVQPGADPLGSTEELEALDIRHLVSSFTTYHNCCQPRVQNIQMLADLVDGALVPPGETFGLNDHVGERTEARGFQPAGTIVLGELVDTVGGGVSQFATTFYNAVFWGGYEDVEHRHHSFYFTRYPEGIEATISWPVPELTFRNNTESTILIKTEYTDTSITVKFYSNNDGRIVVGEQVDGRTKLEVLDEGGPDARIIESRVSERIAPTDIPKTEYRINPEVAIGSEEEIQTGAEGWTVRVTRIITHRNEETSRDWRVRYRSKRPIIEVHPCSVPEGVKPTDPEGYLEQLEEDNEDYLEELCPVPEEDDDKVEEDGEEQADEVEDETPVEPDEPEEHEPEKPVESEEPADTEEPVEQPEEESDSTDQSPAVEDVPPPEEPKEDELPSVEEPASEPGQSEPSVENEPPAPDSAVDQDSSSASDAAEAGDDEETVGTGDEPGLEEPAGEGG